MRILITNDDGINAPGLDALWAIARDIAGPQGEVWTVAPSSEQSGVSHCISYTQPALITKVADRKYAVGGSPSDCVLAGVFDVMKDARPDLVLVGVNRGNNSGENVPYSGTVGGALEASLHGFKSIALSQYFGPANARLGDPFEAAIETGPRLVRTLVDRGIWENGSYGLFYNVNFPPMPAAEVKGVRLAPQGFRERAEFGIHPVTSPSGRRFFWARGADQSAQSAPGTDARLNLDGYTSVTPMCADYTAHGAMQELGAIFD